MANNKGIPPLQKNNIFSNAQAIEVFGQLSMNSRKPQNNNVDLVLSGPKCNFMTTVEQSYSCPFNKCPKMIFENDCPCPMFSHFNEHCINGGLQFQPAFADKSTRVEFNLHALKNDESKCLGVLAYNGVGVNSDECDFFKRHSRNARPDKYFPMLLMACKTSWNKLLEIKMQRVSHENSEAILVWVITMGGGGVTPQQYAINIKNDNVLIVHTSALKVRDFKISQEPHKIFEDRNCSVISWEQIKRLAKTAELTKAPDNVYVDITFGKYSTN